MKFSSPISRLRSRRKMSRTNWYYEPIAVLISAYDEGSLINGAIRSSRDCSPAEIIVFEGPTHSELNPIRGENPIGCTTYRESVWESEHEKRTAMLKRARDLIRDDFWILTLDADEILVWGQHLRDWLGQLRPGYPGGENVVPIRRTEAGWNPDGGGFYTDVAPSRLIHSSMVDEYLVSCWRIRTPDDLIFEAGHYRAERMPCYGEPHIHHRHYLRRPDRQPLRESKGEEYEYTQAIRELGEVIPSPEDIIEVFRPEDDHGA